MCTEPGLPSSPAPPMRAFQLVVKLIWEREIPASNPFFGSLLCQIFLSLPTAYISKGFPGMFTVEAFLIEVFVVKSLAGLFLNN